MVGVRGAFRSRRFTQMSADKKEDEAVELLREAYRWARQAGRGIAQLRARAQDDVNSGVLSFAAQHVEKAMKAIRAAGKKIKKADGRRP